MVVEEPALGAATLDKSRDVLWIPHEHFVKVDDGSLHIQ
jgi:hypothetical protein